MIHWLTYLFSTVLINNSPEPQFESQTLDSNIEIGYGLAIGDVDGDGKPDILLADKKEFVWYRNGDWKRFVMVENLTESDNVCIAARDINGDGKVEVAVGAQWNPGETVDKQKSGSVHYLIRPDDPTQGWEPVKLHHEPTVHRMRWVKATDDLFHLIVLPLHGQGNKGGAGKGVKVIAYEQADQKGRQWKNWVIDQSMHVTHNMDPVSRENGETLQIGGKEGVKTLTFEDGKWVLGSNNGWLINEYGFGEIRIGHDTKGKPFLAGIEPFHGSTLSIYTLGEDKAFALGNLNRTVLTAAMKQGHGLATGDLLNMGMDQIVVGWREPNDDGDLGIKILVPQEDGSWKKHWLDKNGMACEDLKIADLDGDGKPEIIASGRASKNLKIYWNKSY
tara:strand:- start:13792 stop:14961 length:1170 start_codon:yes stop_codon:yes gene_type:complete